MNFTKEGAWTANKLMKISCLISLIIRDLQIKNYYELIAIPTKKAKIKRLTMSSVSKGVRHMEVPYIANGNKRRHNHFRKVFGQYLLQP